MKKSIKDIETELTYIKKHYSDELKILAEKIDTLRDELRSQNASLANLLSKIISKD